MDSKSVAREEHRDHEAEYRQYLAFMSGADEELNEVRGYGMLPSEREDYTRLYYAPAYRQEVRNLA